MSGRIRTIKPELIEDAVTAGLSDMAFRLFIACILLADDYGNLRYEAPWLRGQVYWNVDVDSKAFFDALGELESKALVLPYMVKGQRYASIKNWKKHQRVQKPGKPRVPSPPESLQNSSGESPETLPPDLRSPIVEDDQDLEGDLPARASESVADAPVENALPPDELDDDLPLDAPLTLDSELPDAWAARAAKTIQRTGSCDVTPEIAWASHVAWLVAHNITSTSEAEFMLWVSRECSQAIRRRATEHHRDWNNATRAGPPRNDPRPELSVARGIEFASEKVDDESRVAMLKAAGLA